MKIYTYPLCRKRRWLEDFSSAIGSFKTFGKIIKENRRSERFRIDLIASNHSGPAFSIFLHPGSKSIPKVFHFHGAWDIEEQNTIDLFQGARKNFIYKIMPKNPELVIHYRAMSCRDYSSKPQVKLNSKKHDHRKTLLSAGVSPWNIPRFIWKIYKHLRKKFFYELTKEELLVARGKDETRRSFYERFV